MKWKGFCKRFINFLEMATIFCYQSGDIASIKMQDDAFVFA